MGLIALVLTALGALGYARFLAPVAARPYRIVRGPVLSEVFGRGTVESQREADLGFDLVGRLSDVLVDEGDRISLGQELARLFPEQVQADLKAASTGVAAARTSLERIAADERHARAALEAAEREERRARSLGATGILPSRDVDAALDQVRMARADLDAVLAHRAEATRGIEVASGGVEQRRATALRATLLAPFDGLVTRRLREPGDTVTVGTTVLRIVDTQHAYVRTWVDETQVTRIHEGQIAQIVFPGDPAPIAATVTRVGWESDRQSHELLVDVTPLAIERRVSMGQRADVWITTSTSENALYVPTALVAHDAQGALTYVDRQGKVAVVRLELGVVGRDVIEVLSGLQEGDVVLGPAQPGSALPVGRRWRDG